MNSIVPTDVEQNACDLSNYQRIFSAFYSDPVGLTMIIRNANINKFYKENQSLC